MRDVIEEERETEKEKRGGAEVDGEEEETDPISEFLEFITTGIPSYTMQQFISRNLSAGNLQKSFDGLFEALTSVQATLMLAVQPACEQIVWRAEELRACSRDERYASIGLSNTATSELCERASSLHLHAHTLSRTVLSLRLRYTAFSQWFVACVRLVNNEHLSLPAPSADASQEEKDAQEIPPYGPWEVEVVEGFVREEMEKDRLGESIGDIKKSVSGSLVNTYNAFVTSFRALERFPTKFMSSQVKVMPFVVDLATAQPLVSAANAPFHYSCVGLPAGCALQSKVNKEKGEHLAAYLWANDGVQYVTVLSAHAAAVGSDSPPVRQITVHIPSSATTSDDTAASIASVRSVEFYSATELHLLVQYSIPDGSNAAANPSSKMWLLDLEAAEAEEQWSEIDEEAVSTSAASLSDYLATQISSGSLRICSLLPSESTSVVPSRSRLFPSLSLGSIALNSLRSLAAVMVSAGRSGNDATQPREEGGGQGALLLQQLYKPTRRVVLIDIDENDEEEDTNESTAVDVQMQEDALLADVEMGDAGTPSRTPSRTPSKPSSTRNSFGVVHSSGKKSNSVSLGSPMLTILIALIAIFSCFTTPAHGSAGDVDSRYRFCLDVCSSRCYLLNQAALTKVNPDSGKPYGLGANPWEVLKGEELQPWSTETDPSYVVSPELLTWYEKSIFGWDCKQNCAYLCMHANVILREQMQQPIVKYYGKWPFLRLFGTQEFFSSFFSVLNAVPHVYWLFKLREMYEGVDYPMKTIWTIYSLMNINTWLWSTVFHARDFLWTERLDYFCASLGISFSLCVAIIRIFEMRSWTKRIMLVFAPVGALLCAHISYLQFIHFDYGWNMKVSLTVGIIHSLIWLYNSWLNRHTGYQWRMVVVTLGLWCFASLEVYDFPPMFSLLDAHSLWHGLTPILGFLFYTWVVEDVKYMIGQQMLLDKNQ